MHELDAKEIREVQVFAAFAKVSGLNITEIKSGISPEPDISCTLEGNSYFFELAEVVPQVQAEALSTKGSYSTGIPDTTQGGLKAMVNIIGKKQEKTYQTHGAPVDLLLYFNKDLPMYLSDLPSNDADAAAIHLAAKECKQKGPFTRIWAYDSWKDTAKLLA